MKLTPTPFAVLRYLIERPGRLVTKDELLKALWPDATVTDWVLTASVYEVRKALGDEARAPRFLETVHRRGYRFVGSLESAPPRRQSERIPDLGRPVHSVVGRADELAQMTGWLDAALAGERQVRFVVGEAGIGKTSLLEAFVGRVAAPASVAVGWGQCIQHYGPGEAYLPVLEALGQLCRSPLHDRLVAVVRHYAPTWLGHLPWLIGEAEREAVQRRVQSATSERMLRELAEAWEMLTTEGAVALVLEDLQWSDHATLDFVSYLARRRGDARLLVLGTYRPAEVLARSHPLRAVKQELPPHGRCQDLALKGLSESGVREYLGSRLPGVEPEAGLVQWLHQRTDGNPLFVVNMVDYMLARGLVIAGNGAWALGGPVGVEEWVPESLREIIERQLEGLSPEEQRVLEAASVAGVEFPAAAVAAALETEVLQIEESCHGLARRQQFLRSSGTCEWPDGMVAGRYGFVHALYRRVLYERIGAARRVRFHQRIGEREEAAYGGRVAEIAAELAVHFERGRDYRRAVQYLERAGGNAIQRSAYREAITHLSRGLKLLETLADTPERTRQELLLQTALGLALMPINGYAAPEVERAYARARELSQNIGESAELFLVRYGLLQFYNVRAELRTGSELAEQLLRVAQHGQDPSLLVAAHMAFGAILSWQGEFAPARAQFEQSIALYDARRHRSLAFLYGQDPGVTSLIIMAFNLWFLGYPDEARKRVQDALTLARELSHSFSSAFSLICASWIHQLLREPQAARTLAEEAMALAAEQGFPLWVAVGTVLQGWAVAEQGQHEEGIALIRRGEATYLATGAAAGRTHHLALLAETYGKAGQAQEGLTVLDEALALAAKTGERFYEAELYRLRGALLLAQEETTRPSNAERGSETAEGCFHQAIDIARRQGARSLELRAVMSLSRLWQRQGKREEARKMLAGIYCRFTEGFDTADLQEANGLLTELAGPPRLPPEPHRPLEPA